VKLKKTGKSSQPPSRERILEAAMQAFMELGYAATSTLEIATRARVSKRELYTQFGNKQAMLAAAITDRVQRMQLIPELPKARTREVLEAILVKVGAAVLREVLHPHVMAVFRLAIAEAQRAPEVAQTLEIARQTVRSAAEKVVAQAQSAGLLGPGDAVGMSNQFLSLLLGDLMVSVLLRVREMPGPTETERRARSAAADFLRLNPAAEPGMADFLENREIGRSRGG
jgi:AcrR family transcriptional regulator